LRLEADREASLAAQYLNPSAAVAVGGDALNGKIIDKRFYLRNHGTARDCG
jgi:hypothetical protein